MPIARPAYIFAAPALLLSAAVVARAAQPVVATPAGAASEVRGQRVFIRCASCHAVAEGAPAKIGPNLRGVVGRKAGSVPGYAYSPAMKAADFHWDDATLDRWLTRPSSVVPGTSMAFVGLSVPEDRKAVIAYLRKASR